MRFRAGVIGAEKITLHQIPGRRATIEFDAVSAVPGDDIPRPAAVPPRVLSGPWTSMPMPLLPRALVPAALVPMKLPCTKYPEPVMSKPPPPLPEMTFARRSWSLDDAGGHAAVKVSNAVQFIPHGGGSGIVDTDVIAHNRNAGCATNVDAVFGIAGDDVVRLNHRSADGVVVADDAYPILGVSQIAIARKIGADEIALHLIACGANVDAMGAVPGINVGAVKMVPPMVLSLAGLSR